MRRLAFGLVCFALVEHSPHEVATKARVLHPRLREEAGRSCDSDSRSQREGGESERPGQTKKLLRF
jgi:hypothetical protein